MEGPARDLFSRIGDFFFVVKLGIIPHDYIIGMPTHLLFLLGINLSIYFI